MHLSHLVETIDTHTAGNPTRNLIAGVPRIEGKTMQDKMAYAEELKANKAKELYNKMRNRYQMRCSRAPGNQKMREDYNAWRKQAQIALSKYQLGEIGWEEFEKVIRSGL